MFLLIKMTALQFFFQSIKKILFHQSSLLLHCVLLTKQYISAICFFPINFGQTSCGKILISIKEKYDYIVVITEETKDLFKLSIKELVESFHAHEKRRFFREDQPKETTFLSNK